MSLAKDVEMTSAGITPNPVAINEAYLVQIGAVQIEHTWSDWGSTTWAEVSNLQWGA